MLSNFESPYSISSHTSSSDTLNDVSTTTTNTTTATTNFAKSESSIPAEEIMIRRFAPLSTPMNQRLQTLAVFWHSISIPVFASLTLFAIAFFPITWTFLVPYFICYFTDKAYLNGGVTNRWSDTFRDLSVWHYFCDYFPIIIHKEQDLDPTFTEEIIKDDYYIKIKINKKFETFLIKNFPNFIEKIIINHKICLIYRSPYKKLVSNGKKYIFCYHPHGVVSMGAFGGVGTNGANWSKLFPGIRVSLGTIETQFVVPIYREYLLALGIGSVAKKNLEAVLEKNYSVGIVIGGARESLLSKPNTCKLILKHRKGFIKIALRTKNCQVVPIFGFGETDIYEIIEPSKTSKLRKFQLLLKKLFGFTIPFFHARGIFNYDFGLLPYRRRIDVVVGKPIDIPYDPEPSDETIDKWHDIYIERLLELVENNRAKYNYTPQIEVL